MNRPTPRVLTDAIVAAFRDATSGILPVTREVEYLTFEKGLYAHIVVKPIKRIARLIAADRELLVLFSSFEDQQPRTIETAVNLIDSSLGRLEHTIAVIVHADPAGNAKLREWGRESSLSVIPIYVPGGIPRGEALERLLFAEFFANDAFDVSGPVSDDDRFYGRRSEAQDAARQLQRGQVRACLGIRKTGKTSVIHRIIDVLEAAYDCIAVMIDCSKDTVWERTDGQLLASIADAIGTATRSGKRYVVVQPIRSSQDLGDAAERLLEQVKESRKPVILFFDETDYITPGSPTAAAWKTRFNPFWRNLRAVYQEAHRSGAILSIFVSGVSSKWFRAEAIEGIENAALAFIPEEYLSPLQGAASASMIKTLARTCGLQFDDRGCDRIATACGNIPYWIRKACSFVHRSVPVETRPYEVSQEEVESLLNAFVDAEGAAIAEVALSHLFRVYPDLELPAESCLTGQEAIGVPAATNPLEKYGFLCRREGTLSVSGRMMEEGMRLFISNRAVKPISGGSALQYAGLTDWAEEIALCGARRNKIERRLRSLVLNFLRFDSLQQKAQMPLVDRVGRFLEEARRKQFKHLSADEIVERFNWTDLTRLMEKEWSLFQSLFGDRSAFTQHSLVINDRFDAHAKLADRAHIALYRRSLDYFEESLART